MKTTKLLRSIALAACVGAVACQPANTGTDAAPSGARTSGSASAAKPEGGKQVAATVGSREILVSEVDAGLESELARIEMELYRARKGRLDQMISQALVEEKAKELGISTDELAEKEIASKIEPPDEETVKQYYERFKAQGQTAPLEELAPRIREALSRQAMQQRQNEYLASLRKEANVSIELSAPRIAVSTSGGVSNGPEDAPVTLVEFSDYQCPFCARSQDTVQKVLKEYDGKIRHVFMDFPLDSIHPEARPAAEAARCAGEQDKFWEYHDVLYEKQRELSEENYRKWAEELSLDGEKFAKCLESDKFDAVIEENLQAGQQAGVSGTPGFFVNGIMINGAQPFDVFQETIDDELSRAGG